MSYRMGVIESLMGADFPEGNRQLIETLSGKCVPADKLAALGKCGIGSRLLADTGILDEVSCDKYASTQSEEAVPPIAGYIINDVSLVAREALKNGTPYSDVVTELTTPMETFKCESVLINGDSPLESVNVDPLEALSYLIRRGIDIAEDLASR